MQGQSRTEGELITPACLLGRLGPWGKFDPGELSLSEGIVAFTSSAHGLVFRAPLQEVRARFPKLYFGIGIKLAVRDKTYRLWFVRLQSMRGEQVGGETVVVGFKFRLRDVDPARVASRQWRAALSTATHSGS
jgi:hypothetical protein